MARLVQLGIRQSRYFGRVKTRFQLYLAATVANLTLVAGKSGLSDSVGGGAEAHRVVRSAVPSDVQAVSHGVVANATAIFGAVRLGILWTVILLKPALLPKSLSPTRGFSARFLGGNVHRRLNARRGFLIWHDRLRAIPVLEASGPPLLGMRLLAGSQLTAQIRNGGDVLIEEL